MWVDLIYTLVRDSMFGKGKKQVLCYLQETSQSYWKTTPEVLK